MMEFSLFNCGFHFYHDIWRDGVHLMGSFCVFCNFSHQLSFGGSRGLKPTVLGNTCKGWHLLHQCVIIVCVYLCLSSFSDRDALTTIPTVTSKRIKRRYFILHPYYLGDDIFSYLVMACVGRCRSNIDGRYSVKCSATSTAAVHVSAESKD